MFFPFPISLWAICLPLLLQCVICTKWGFKSLFTGKIREGARRSPVPRIFHQECEECPDLCGPHSLSQLNNKNGAMPKPGSRNSLMKTFMCRAFRTWHIDPDRQSLHSPDAIWWSQRQAWGRNRTPFSSVDLCPWTHSLRLLLAKLYFTTPPFFFAPWVVVTRYFPLFSKTTCVIFCQAAGYLSLKRVN